MEWKEGGMFGQSAGDWNGEKLDGRGKIGKSRENGQIQT
jgi:hypothetical protein